MFPSLSLSCGSASYSSHPNLTSAQHRAIKREPCKKEQNSTKSAPDVKVCGYVDFIGHNSVWNLMLCILIMHCTYIIACSNRQDLLTGVCLFFYSLGPKLMLVLIRGTWHFVHRFLMFSFESEHWNGSTGTHTRAHTLPLRFSSSAPRVQLIFAVFSSDPSNWDI